MLFLEQKGNNFQHVDTFFLQFFACFNDLRRGFGVWSGWCGDDDVAGGEMVAGGNASNSFGVSSMCC